MWCFQIVFMRLHGSCLSHLQISRRYVFSFSFCFHYVGSSHLCVDGAAMNGLFCCWVCGSGYLCIGLRHLTVPSNICCLLAQANCKFTRAICLFTFSCLVAQATCSSQELWSYWPLSLSHMMHHCSGLAWLKMNAPAKAMPQGFSKARVFVFHFGRLTCGFGAGCVVAWALLLECCCWSFISATFQKQSKSKQSEMAPTELWLK